MLRVSAGVGISALGTYALLAVVSRAIGPSAYVSFSLGWGLLLVMIAGMMVPLEQETARLAASRCALGQPAASVLAAMTQVAARLAAATAGLLLLAAPLLLGPLGLGWPALAAVALSVALAAPGHLLRGLLAGAGAFGRYSAVLVVEASVRLVLVVACAGAGVQAVAPYLLAVGVGSALAGLVAVSAARPPMSYTADHQSPPRDRTAVLALASSAAQVVLNAPPVLVALLAVTVAERDALAPLLAAALLARVPLFGFTAVQAGLIPELSARVAAGDVRGMLRVVRRLLAAVALLTVAFCLLAIVAGESAIVALFGEPFRLAGGHLAILGLASGAYLLAASSAAALTVLARHADVLYAWLAGLSTLGLVAAGVSDTLLRVELSLLAGCSVAAVVLLGTLLRQVLSRPS